MNHYFIKDNRIRFFNLALVVVLLSLIAALFSKIQDQLAFIIRHQEVFLVAMTQVVIVITWVYMGVNETIRFIGIILFPISIVQSDYQVTVSIHKPILTESLYISQQHRYMVMRC